MFFTFVSSWFSDTNALGLDSELSCRFDTSSALSLREINLLFPFTFDLLLMIFLLLVRFNSFWHVLFILSKNFY
tara:strand:- start:58 stop:279 length:222 start_codon:yes stop_codon:yes gene_type:complete